MTALETIASLFAEPGRKQRRVRELAERLVAFIEAPQLRERIDALERLSRFVMKPDAAMPLPGAAAASSLPAELRRAVAFVGVLEAAPQLGEPVRAAFAAMAAEAAGLGLLAETGLPNDRGLFNETADRLLRRLLPAPRDDHELSRLLLRLFPTERELRWLEGLPPDLFMRLGEVLGAGDGDGVGGGAGTGAGAGLAPLAAAAGEAFALLNARVSALGLTEEMRARGSGGPVRGSPFFQLPRAGDLVLAHLEQPGPRLQGERVWRDVVARCQRETEVVLAHLEDKGISVDVVYGLEVIEQALSRMEHLLAVLVAPAGSERLAATYRLLLVLVRARLSDRSLRELFRGNARLLSRKIIDRAGQTGEHYVAHTRRQYVALLLGAAGGGVLTTLTASGKLGISGAGFPPFGEGFLSGLLYALSFIVIQLFGFTLATKQPSMTAAHLAAMIGRASGPNRLAEVASYTARIARSQLAAAIGNVTFVSLGAYGLDQFWRWRTGHAFLGDAKADYVLGSFHPGASGTIWYAILTGFILWVSSLVAGWIENFAVYRRVPQGIAEHGLGRFIGARAMGAIARFFARNVSGYGGSVALGFMLGMTPILGKFFGLPLDVRHVTLSAGTLVLAALAKGQAILSMPALWWACAGIAVIFVFNLSTSFLLALSVALRARDVTAADRLALLRALLGRALRHPGEFLLPPRKGETEPAGHEHGHAHEKEAAHSSAPGSPAPT
jgi:site-specific recombinase